MRLKAKKGDKYFEDRTTNSKARVDEGWDHTVGRGIKEENKRRQAKTEGENDEWVPIKYRNGYHRSQLGKVPKGK